MSISDKINPNFLSALFDGNELVSVQLPTITQEEEYIYSRVKNLVIIAPYLDEYAEKDQLNKILSACKLSPSDFAIHQGNCSWAALRKYQNIENVLLFGILEKNIGICFNIIENQIIRFDNRNWIRTYELSRFLKDDAAKNILWQQALKPLYIG